MQNLPTKIGNEIWECSLDLEPWISGGNAVSGITAQVVTGPVTIVSASLASPTLAKFKISGGTAGSVSLFNVSATMNDGQVFSERFHVYVE